MNNLKEVPQVIAIIKTKNLIQITAQSNGAVNLELKN